MSPVRHGHRGMMLAAVTAAAVSMPVTAAFANTPKRDAPLTGQAREITSALQRDLGLTDDQARRQQAQQTEALQLDDRLRTALGAAFAGASYDARTGSLTVSVSDASKLAEVRSAGAQARLVEHSRAALDAVKSDLDHAAGRTAGDNGAQRRAAPQPRSATAAMTSWYVDTDTNSVHVTVAPGRSASAARALAKYGDAVTIETDERAPTTTANYIDGGDEINGGSCSAGFNLRNPSTGQGYLLTAGHCVTAGSTLTGQGGVRFGAVLESWFPTYDDALARNDNPAYWVQGSWVDTNPSNGGVVATRGYTDAPVGTVVCKSGITTKWTCGKIVAKDVTVNYLNYDGTTSTVYGLTRNTACVEHGDSGGAFVSVTTGYAAEGVTSGAALYDNRLCLSKVGGENASYYYPIADSLAYYGPRYGVTVW